MTPLCSFVCMRSLHDMQQVGERDVLLKHARPCHGAGPLPEFFAQSPDLMSLDLGWNHFTGKAVT